MHWLWALTGRLPTAVALHCRHPAKLPGSLLLQNPTWNFLAISSTCFEFLNSAIISTTSGTNFKCGSKFQLEQDLRERARSLRSGMVVRLWNTRTRIRNVQRRPQIRQLTETSATTLGAAAPLPPLSSRAQRFAAPGGAAGVWRTVNALAARPGMVNMGQGFPDFPGSAVARAAARDALGKSADSSFA